MAKKSTEKQVKEIYPDAVYMKMGFGNKFLLHNVYSDGTWKTLIGQGADKKTAWESALRTGKDQM